MSDHTPPTHAPARSWGSTLFAVCGAQAAAIAAFDFTLPFIPLYLQQNLGVHGIGQTALWSGLISFGPAIPATIFAPLWGRVADRFGYRAMLLRAMISASVILALMGLAPSPSVLLLLRMVQGALTGTIQAAQALVATGAPEEETARSMGMLQMSVYVGATVGPVGGGAVAELVGFRATFAAAGVLLAVASAVVFVFVREPRRRPVRQGDSRVEQETKPSLLSVLTIPTFAAALAFTLVVQLAVTQLLPIIPLVVQDLLHSGRNVAADTGWLMALSGLTAAGGSFVASRLQRHTGLKPMLLLLALLSAGLIVPQGAAGSFAVFLLLRCLASFAFGGLWSVVGTWAALSSPANAKGTAFGLMGAASSLGFGSGPLLGGTLAAAFGLRPVFVVSGVLIGAMPLLMIGGTAVLPALRRLRISYAQVRLRPER